MIIHVSIFGRGRTLMVRDFDVNTSGRIIFGWAKLRGNVAVRSFSLICAEDGGLLFRTHRDGRTQGWQLRGPVEHFEYPY